MKKVRFKVYLEYDPEYKGYVADVPSLPGCMAQGKSEEEVEIIQDLVKEADKHVAQIVHLEPAVTA